MYRGELRSASGKVQYVAIRRIARGVSNDADAQRVLLEEARIWVSLRHPNIVTIVDIGQHETDWFLVLELVDGASVDEMLRTLGPMTPREALCIVHRTALALHAAHTLVLFGKKTEVVHRDVKPANILVGANGVVKLTDFGIARASDRLGRTAAGIVKGSLHFLAPEQVRKEPLDARTDLFALGCTFHTMVTCKPLLDLPKDTVLRTLARDEIPPPPVFLPAKVRELAAKMVAPKPSDRFPSALALADAVREVLAPEAPESVEEALADRVRRFREALTGFTLDTSAISAVGMPSARTMESPGKKPPH